MIPSEAPENFTQVNFLPKIIGIQMHFIFLYNSFVYFDFRPLVMILPNLPHFGHDSSCYFNSYRRTMHHIMIK